MQSRLFEVCWIDYTKGGRLTQEALDHTITLGQSLLKHNPRNSVMLVISPTIASDKTKDGLSGERQRIETKLRAKDYVPELVALTATKEAFKSNNIRRTAFKAWVAFESSTMPPEDAKVSDATAMRQAPDTFNAFLLCDLRVCETNSVRPSLLTESAWVIPEASCKNACPKSHEGRKHFSEAQEQAMQTAGVSFASEVLKSLFARTSITNKDAVIVYNLTPYEGSLEDASLTLQMDSASTLPSMATFSVTPDQDIAMYLKDTLQAKLIEARAAQQHAKVSK